MAARQGDFRGEKFRVFQWKTRNFSPPNTHLRVGEQECKVIKVAFLSLPFTHFIIQSFIHFKNKTMKKIGVFTSGGDAPGMNACIRAVVRTAIHHGLEVVGIRKGYQGIVDKDFIPMTAHSVSNIIQKGGTILKSARCTEFRTKKGLKNKFQPSLVYYFNKNYISNAFLTSLFISSSSGLSNASLTATKKPTDSLPSIIL